MSVAFLCTLRYTVGITAFAFTQAQKAQNMQKFKPRSPRRATLYNRLTATTRLRYVANWSMSMCTMR